MSFCDKFKYQKISNIFNNWFFFLMQTTHPKILKSSHKHSWNCFYFFIIYNIKKLLFIVILHFSKKKKHKKWNRKNSPADIIWCKSDIFKSNMHIQYIDTKCMSCNILFLFSLSQFCFGGAYFCRIFVRKNILQKFHILLGRRMSFIHIDRWKAASIHVHVCVCVWTVFSKAFSLKFSSKQRTENIKKKLPSTSCECVKF